MKIFLLLFLLLSFSVRAAFVSGTDIPLMDGLAIDENEGFSFDTPAGQIVTVLGRTTATKKEIETFYQDSLTALGWRQISSTKYRRDQDELVLQISPAVNKIEVRLQLTFSNK